MQLPLGSVTVQTEMRKILCIFAESIWQTWLISAILNTALYHLSRSLQIWKRAGLFSIVLREDNLSATESTSYVCPLIIDWYFFESALLSFFCFNVFVQFPWILCSVRSPLTRAVVGGNVLLWGFFVCLFFLFVHVCVFYCRFWCASFVPEEGKFFAWLWIVGW